MLENVPSPMTNETCGFHTLISSSAIPITSRAQKRVLANGRFNAYVNACMGAILHLMDLHSGLCRRRHTFSSVHRRDCRLRSGRATEMAKTKRHADFEYNIMFLSWCVWYVVGILGQTDVGNDLLATILFGLRE